MQTSGSLREITQAVILNGRWFESIYGADAQREKHSDQDGRKKQEVFYQNC